MEKYKKSSAEKNMKEGTEKIRKEAYEKAMNLAPVEDEQTVYQEDTFEDNGYVIFKDDLKEMLQNKLNILEGESIYLNNYYKSGCIDTIKMLLNQL